MEKFYETKAFLKERDRWYARLSKEGFADIEIVTNTGEISLNMLRGMSPGDLTRGLYKPEAEDYYRFARQHLWEVRGWRARAVWALHAEGLSVEKIVARLASKSWKSGRATRSACKKIIAEEQARMRSRWAADIQEAWNADSQED